MVEATLQTDIATYFEQNQVDKLVDAIFQNRHIIFEVCEVFPQVLLSSDSNNIRNTFQTLEGLIKAFGISLVLQLNKFDVVALLQNLIQQGWGKQINKLLDLCMMTFSFDPERANIQFLANLWIQQNLDAANFPTTKISQTPFLNLFCKIQEILPLPENLSSLTPQDKKKYSLSIRKLLKYENFENNQFNPLEQDLATYYYNEFVSVLSSLEPESAVQNTKEIAKEIENVLEKSQIMRKKETPAPTGPLKNDKMPLLKHKTCFVLGDRIYEDEDIHNEYKAYSLPFGEFVEKILKKTIGGFLNRRGGRIYIGISDDKLVKGIFMNYKERDMLRLQIQNMLKVFEPPVLNSELVQIAEIPIIHPDDKQTIPGCFILKIIVKQGDPSKLYSVTNLAFESYIRNPGQNTRLTAREISDYIVQRNNAPGKSAPEEEFNDPKPDEIKDIYEKKEEEGLSTSKILYDQTARNQRNKPEMEEMKSNNVAPGKPNAPNAPGNKQTYVVFVQGLPRVSQQQFDELLRKTNLKTIFWPRLFKYKDGTSNGKAFINLKDLKEANQLVADWNNKKIQGSLVKAELQNSQK